MHHLAGIRRNVNAGDIATFITKMRQSEAVLRQQRHDAERRTDEASPDPSLPVALPNSTPFVSSNPWSSPVVYEQFEELK